MTDEQIIKALECCGVESGSCEKCPSKYRRRSDCIRLLTIDAINLINRQQAGINQFAEANKMVADLKTVKNDDDIKAIQRDAVVNFVEKLKEQAFECDISFGLGSQHIRQAVAVDDIDNLVIEMFGNPEEVKCKDCKHLMYSDCYGECSQGYKGIVQPDDSCKYGERKLK